jgi:hypothetical protein
MQQGLLFALLFHSDHGKLTFRGGIEIHQWLTQWQNLCSLELIYPLSIIESPFIVQLRMLNGPFTLKCYMKGYKLMYTCSCGKPKHKPSYLWGMVFIPPIYSGFGDYWWPNSGFIQVGALKGVTGSLQTSFSWWLVQSGVVTPLHNHSQLGHLRFKICVLKNRVPLFISGKTPDQTDHSLHDYICAPNEFGNNDFYIFYPLDPSGSLT